MISFSRHEKYRWSAQEESVYVYVTFIVILPKIIFII